MADDGTSRLFVQDLPPHCDEQALRKHFAQYGVTDVQIPRRKSDKKKGRGFAFVGLKDADSARRAAKALNGAYWRTSKLRVAPAAKRKAPQPPAPPPLPTRSSPAPFLRVFVVNGGGWNAVWDGLFFGLVKTETSSR